MLDMKFIRENRQAVENGLKSKRVTLSLEPLLELDEKRRSISTKIDDLRGQQNRANDEIAALMRNKQDAKEKIAAMKAIANEIDQYVPAVKEIEEKMQSVLLMIPNIPHTSVPIGGADQNAIVKSWGELPKFDFQPKAHVELAEALDIVDFKRGAKLSGSNFILYKKQGALLERALYNFMLDVHTREHGYTEVFPPVLVNPASMTGTGQLPKMKDDMYRLDADDLYLIPTAEVPVTNIHRDETLNEEELPIRYTAYSACFRREAGSYGKDTRGLMRVHQFDKVELVKFVRPETSYDELESLLFNAETIFHKLKIPYRVLQLASGDLSFAAAKCYDIEVYAAGLDKWLEASSCSNFEDFQARRAILENYQTKEGTVIVPEVLRPYMGGLPEIKRS
jgi:seryl-tRNA synthetase